MVMAKAAAALRLALITLLLLPHGLKDNGRSRSDTAPTITCSSNTCNQITTETTIICVNTAQNSSTERGGVILVSCLQSSPNKTGLA